MKIEPCGCGGYWLRRGRWAAPEHFNGYPPLVYKDVEGWFAPAKEA